MTSPDVNVGSIIARVALDTTGLKRGEADVTSSLKRTTEKLDQTAKSADRASTAVKRNADTTVTAVRRTAQAQTEADMVITRSAKTRSTVEEAAGKGARGGAAAGAVAGVIIQQTGTAALQAIGDGKGGTRDQISGGATGALNGAVTGAAIGSIVPGVGTAVGAVVGGVVGGVAGSITANGPNDKMERMVFEKGQQVYLDAVKKVRDAGYIGQRRAVELVQQAPAEYQAAVADLLKAELAGKPEHVKRWTPSQMGVAVSQGQLTKAANDVSAVRWAPVGSQFDVAPDVTVGDPIKAAARVDAASTRVANAQDRVTAAARRLENVRKNSKSTASQLASAEQSLATAQRHLADAQSKLEQRKGEAAKAGGSTALGAGELLKRSAAELKQQQGLAGAAKKLLAEGVSGPVLQNLEDLEKTAPGTMARIAATITPAMVHQLNADQGHLQRAYADFLRAPREAAMKTAAAESARAARAYANQTADDLTRAFQDAGLPLPLGLRPNGPGPTPKPGKITPRSLAMDNPDNPRKGGGDVTFTGPVTINTNSKQGLLADPQVRINALSRP